MKVTDLMSNQRLQELSKVLYQIGNNRGYRVGKEELMQLLELDPSIMPALINTIGVIRVNEVWGAVTRQEITLKHVYRSLNVEF